MRGGTGSTAIAKSVGLQWTGPNRGLDKHKVPGRHTDRGRLRPLASARKPALGADANAGVTLGSFAVCGGWASCRPGSCPGWSGWLAIVSEMGCTQPHHLDQLPSAAALPNVLAVGAHCGDGDVQRMQSP